MNLSTTLIPRTLIRLPGAVRRSGREYAHLHDRSIVPTPPSVAGVGHGSEPPWLTHLTVSTRAVSSVSLTRTVVMGAPCASLGPSCGRSARSGGLAAGSWGMPDLTSSTPAERISSRRQNDRDTITTCRTRSDAV